MSKSGPESDVGIWMPVYLGDYLAETQRLSTEQHGAYFLMLIDYWRNGPLPDKDSVLQTVTRLERKSWNEHKEVLRGLFESRDGHLCSERMDQIKAKAVAHRVTNSRRAQNAANTRWRSKTATECGALDDPQSNASSSAPSISRDSLDESTSTSPSKSTQKSPSPSPSPESSSDTSSFSSLLPSSLRNRRATPFRDLVRPVLERVSDGK